MQMIKVFAMTALALVGTATSAAANPAPLLATAIQGFLLSSTAIAATLTGTIATIAANAILIGSAEGGFTILPRRDNDRS